MAMRSSRELERDDFAAAIAFVNRVAELAAERPTITPTSSSTATSRSGLTLSTHAAGGLTQRDFELAAQIDALPERRSRAVAPARDKGSADACGLLPLTGQRRPYERRPSSK